MAIMEPRVYQWMYARLTGDAQVMAVFGTRVYRKVIPQAASYPPSLVMQYMGGGTLAVINGIRIWSDMLFMIKATGTNGQYTNLRNGMDRVDALLHRATGSVTGAQIIWCEQVNEVPIEPVVYSGETYEQIAVMYRVKAHAA